MTNIFQIIKPPFQKLDKPHGVVMMIYEGEGVGILLGKTRLRDGKSIKCSNKVETQFIKIDCHYYIEHTNSIELFVTVIKKSDRDQFIEGLVEGEPFNVVFINRDKTMIQVAGVYYNDSVDYFEEADFYD